MRKSKIGIIPKMVYAYMLNLSTNGMGFGELSVYQVTLQRIKEAKDWQLFIHKDE